MRLTEQEVEEIRKRLADAHPANCWGMSASFDEYNRERKGVCLIPDIAGTDGEFDIADGRFASNAVVDIPRLLSDRAALLRELEELRHENAVLKQFKGEAK